MDVSSPETWRWIWLALAVGFTVGELAVAGTFFLLPFAVGAGLAAGAAFVGASVGLEWMLFVAGSAAACGVLWPVGRRLNRRSPLSPTGAHRWAGREGYVVRDIPAGPGGAGLVRLDREEWRAESLTSTPIPAGSTVLVSRVDGTRLVVVSLDGPAGSLPDPDPTIAEPAVPPARPPAPSPTDPATEPGTS